MYISCPIGLSDICEHILEHAKKHKIDNTVYAHAGQRTYIVLMKEEQILNLGLHSADF